MTPSRWRSKALTPARAPPAERHADGTGHSGRAVLYHASRARTRYGGLPMAAVYRLPLLFTPEPEGSYTVTSPLLPELVTCGHDLADALAHVEDALAAV